MKNLNILCENSITENIWAINQKSYEEIAAIAHNYGLSYLAANIIANREIKFDDLESFLKPSIQNSWLDPKKLPDMEKAIQLFKNIIEKNGIVGILGDYDVDGLSSSVIIKELCNAFNLKTHIWIPSRADGYGPSDSAFDFFNTNNIDILIMVDCGSNSREFAAKFNQPIIVIDHHTIDTLIELSDTKCVINAHRNDVNVLELFEYKKLCATSVSFLFAHQICSVLQMEKAQSQKLLTSWLDLVALGTVCDCMELSAFNKALVKKGLEQLEKQMRPGIKILLNKSSLKFPLCASDIGFYIGPRLNAAARIDNAFIAFELLDTHDEKIAIELGNKLERLNEERKIVQKYAFDEACEMLVKSNEHETNEIICIAHNNWHIGVIGIIAAQIQEKFKKPTIIGTINAQIVRASARSNSVNIGNIIQKAVLEKILISGGGHSAAGGLACHEDQWEAFRNWIQLNTEEIAKTPIVVDAIVEMAQIEDDFKKLGPFGQGNETPIILSRSLTIINIIDYEKYSKITLQQNYKNHTFFMQAHNQLIPRLRDAQKLYKSIDVLIKLGEKGFNNIEDFKYSQE